MAVVVWILACAVLSAPVISGHSLSFKSSWQTIFRQMRDNPVFTESVREPSQQAPTYTWSCNAIPSLGEPTSVHALTPADIDVVAALGDSITAGNGVFGNSLPEVALEHRGEVWSIGGDGSIANVITLANILREYNPDLRGFSRRTGTHNFPGSNLNVAIPGARAHNMPSQAETLINRLHRSEYDFENDWKIITILIGGNDLCAYCFDREFNSAENHAARIEEALDILHDAVPRALVNLVPMLDVTPLPFHSTGFICNQLQQGFCNCAVDEDTRGEMRPIQLEYYERLRALVDSGKYDTRDDFTVVIQPFLVDQEPPLTNDGDYDPDWLAGDCFHPSKQSHQAMAVLLWNNMFEPEGQKSVEYDWNELQMTPTYFCPTTDQPYIYTRLNSNQ